MSETPGLVSVFQHIYNRMQETMVDSSLESTRVFWRRKLGWPEEVVNDPRPAAEALARYEAERQDSPHPE